MRSRSFDDSSSEAEEEEEEESEAEEEEEEESEACASSSGAGTVAAPAVDAPSARQHGPCCQEAVDVCEGSPPSGRQYIADELSQEGSSSSRPPRDDVAESQSSSCRGDGEGLFFSEGGAIGSLAECPQPGGNERSLAASHRSDVASPAAMGDAFSRAELAPEAIDLRATGCGGLERDGGSQAYAHEGGGLEIFDRQEAAEVCELGGRAASVGSAIGAWPWTGDTDVESVGDSPAIFELGGGAGFSAYGSRASGEAESPRLGSDGSDIYIIGSASDASDGGYPEGLARWSAGPADRVAQMRGRLLEARRRLSGLGAACAGLAVDAKRVAIGRSNVRAVVARHETLAGEIQDILRLCHRSAVVEAEHGGGGQTLAKPCVTQLPPRPVPGRLPAVPASAAALSMPRRLVQQQQHEHLQEREGYVETREPSQSAQGQAHKTEDEGDTKEECMAAVSPMPSVVTAAAPPQLATAAGPMPVGGGALVDLCGAAATPCGQRPSAAGAALPRVLWRLPPVPAQRIGTQVLFRPYAEVQEVPLLPRGSLLALAGQ